MNNWLHAVIKKKKKNSWRHAGNIRQLSRQHMKSIYRNGSITLLKNCLLTFMNIGGDRSGQIHGRNCPFCSLCCSFKTILSSADEDSLTGPTLHAASMALELFSLEHWPSIAQVSIEGHGTTTQVATSCGETGEMSRIGGMMCRELFLRSSTASIPRKTRTRTFSKGLVIWTTCLLKLM